MQKDRSCKSLSSWILQCFTYTFGSGSPTFNDRGFMLEVLELCVSSLNDAYFGNKFLIFGTELNRL